MNASKSPKPPLTARPSNSQIGLAFVLLTLIALATLVCSRMLTSSSERAKPLLYGLAAIIWFPQSLLALAALLTGSAKAGLIGLSLGVLAIALTLTAGLNLEPLLFTPFAVLEWFGVFMLVACLAEDPFEG